MRRSKGGFTLVELMVSIVCASAVTLAAMSFLLVCFRMWSGGMDTAGEQGTARIVMSVLEDIAENGSGSNTHIVGDPGGDYRFFGDTDNKTVQLYYSAEDGTIYTGGTYEGDTYSGGTPMMSGVTGFDVKADSNGLLTITLETEESSYSTSVYCRTNNPADALLPAGVKLDSIRDAITEQLDTGGADAEKRTKFLEKLIGQHDSHGEIIKNSTDGYDYFSEWYIKGYTEEHSGWNKDTPWCACFVSWGIAQADSGSVVSFASVDDGVKKFGGPGTEGSTGDFGSWKNREETPTPGDLIFFDWEADPSPDESSADHVGAVLLVNGNVVYTIEGNSNGCVALRSYSLSDKRILGYGVVGWGTEGEPGEV